MTWKGMVRFRCRSLTWQGRPGGSGWKAIAWVALIGCAVSGCEGTGPTEPEPVSIPELFGNQLFEADGSPASVGTLEDIPVIGIYFAQPGCPACAAFTPILVDAYAQLQADGRAFEVVLVTGGVSDAALFDYMISSGMPWLALSAGSSKGDALAKRYNVLWVPTLIVIDGSGNTISMTGREEITASGAAIYDVWLAASAGS